MIFWNKSPSSANSMMMLSVRGRLPEAVGFLLVEGFFVADDVRVPDGGQESDFVESVVFFFFL